MSNDPDVGGWQAHLYVPGNAIEHAGAFAADCLPEHAIQLAQAEAVRKYGAQDWTRWHLRAECVGDGRTVHFGWRDGALQRLSAAPVDPAPARDRRSRRRS